ncbi:MAG: hypothetical protein GKR89_21020 [Candidatus Latescibacteria bacterium]|nr:hypothetical protein [Candidatus Latescibacterota bacterium]
MRLAIIHQPPNLAPYCSEIARTWGLFTEALIAPNDVGTLDPATTPVLLCPADTTHTRSADLLAYTHRGGTLIAFFPQDELATAAGLTYQSAKTTPLRLRPVHYPAAGLAGELLPIVGPAATYQAPQSTVLAYLSHPGQYHDESPGVLDISLGQGRLIAFAFDLPHAVLLLRQGDPALAEHIPAGDGCARPSHMACELGANDAAWIPFADLLARFLVDLVRRHLPAPVPLLSHLPGAAPGLLLYSGDEDSAAVTANEEEFAAVQQAGGRMSLYIIPTRTHSKSTDVARYAQDHDLGPHPDIRPLDGAPIADRLAEFRRQILLFQDMFGRPARTQRTHCTAWAGYLEPVEIMQELGVGMDGSYFSGTYMRDRVGAPYAGFGGAMPMHFCHPDGRLLEVYQQHTHLSDDVVFGDADYSYKLSPENFAPQAHRILADIASRFHTPYAVCIHPGNWVKFSRQQGLALLQEARNHNCPIWSFDQWLSFCQARRTWRFEELAWDGQTLHLQLEAGTAHEDLGLLLPLYFQGQHLSNVHLGGRDTAWEQLSRYGEQVALVSLAGLEGTLELAAIYAV